MRRCVSICQPLAPSALCNTSANRSVAMLPIAKELGWAAGTQGIVQVCALPFASASVLDVKPFPRAALACLSTTCLSACPSACSLLSSGATWPRSCLVVLWRTSTEVRG
jgi:hypothetical protein